MKQKTKILTSIVIILIIIIVISLGSKKEEKITIRAAMFQSPATEATQKYVNEFEEKFDIKVELDIYPYVVLREKIMNEFIGGTGTYDLVMADCVWIPEFASNGYLQSIEPYINDPELFNKEEYKLDDIIPAVGDYLGKYPKDGTRYGFPFMTNTHVLAYRKDLYDKYLEPAGIREPGKDSETAWTWDEYIQAAKILTRDEDGDGQNDLWASTLQAKRGGSLVYEWYTYLYSWGGKDFDYSDYTVKLDSPESVKAIDFYADFYRKHKVTPLSVVSWSHSEETEAIAQGLAAMDATWNMELSYWLVNPESSSVYDKISFAMTPKGSVGHPTPDMGGYGLLLTKDSNNPEASFQFMNWITSPEVHKKIVMEGGTPFRYSEMSDAEILAKYPFYGIYDEALESSIYRARVPEWSEIGEKLGIYLSQVMIGEKTSEEAAKDAAEDVRNIMDEAGYYKID